MRLVLAGMFVVIGAAVVALVLSPILPDNPPGWLVLLVIGPTFLFLVLSAFCIFNHRQGERWPFQSNASFVRGLEQKDLIVTKPFSAKRAFELEEGEVEGIHYFIELEDGSVLYLNGLYLYDYEEITEDPNMNQPRKFPCTEFVIRRHKNDHYVVDIFCAGTVIEPECVGRPLGQNDYIGSLIPEDGTVFTDKTYEQLRAQYCEGRPS